MLKPGDVVAYCYPSEDTLVQIGVVKQQCEDELSAFVWYSSGDTAARTPLQYLHPIVNAYALPSLLERSELDV